MRRSRPASTITVTLLVLFGAACAGSDDSTSAEPASADSTPTSSISRSSTTETPLTPSTTTTTATSTTTSTTTTSTTTTTEPTSGCSGEGALPDGAENHTLAGGDVDGDGLVDTLHAYSIGDPAAPGGWWLQVSFAAGGGTALQLFDPGTAVSGVRPFDGIDVNGDSREEFFAVVGAGASATIMGLFHVDGCDLERIDLDGQPSEFAVGGGINFISGFECVDIDGNGANDFVVTYSGARLGETDEFEVIGTQYALVDGNLEFVLADGLGINADDPDFATYSSAGCNAG